MMSGRCKGLRLGEAGLGHLCRDGSDPSPRPGCAHRARTVPGQWLNPPSTRVLTPAPPAEPPAPGNLSRGPWDQTPRPSPLPAATVCLGGRTQVPEVPVSCQGSPCVHTHQLDTARFQTPRHPRQSPAPPRPGSPVGRASRRGRPRSAPREPPVPLPACEFIPQERGQAEERV